MYDISRWKRCTTRFHAEESEDEFIIRFGSVVGIRPELASVLISVTAY